MSSIYEMMQSEEFQALREGTLGLLKNMDPEEVEETLQEVGYDEAVKKIDMDQQEVETDLELISAFVQDLQNEFPEAFRELEESGGIPEDVELPPPEKEGARSSTVNQENLHQSDSAENHGNSITD